MSVQPMVTMKRPRVGQPLPQDPKSPEIASTPNQPLVAQRQNYVINTTKLQDKNQMDDSELGYYVKRLRSKHKRLTTKWLGMRRKHGRDEFQQVISTPYRLIESSIQILMLGSQRTM